MIVRVTIWNGPQKIGRITDTQYLTQQILKES